MVNEEETPVVSTVEAVKWFICVEKRNRPKEFVAMYESDVKLLNRAVKKGKNNFSIQWQYITDTTRTETYIYDLTTMHQTTKSSGVRRRLIYFGEDDHSIMCPKNMESQQCSVDDVNEFFEQTKDGGPWCLVTGWKQKRFRQAIIGKEKIFRCDTQYWDTDDKDETKQTYSFAQYDFEDMTGTDQNQNKTKIMYFKSPNCHSKLTPLVDMKE